MLTKYAAVSEIIVFLFYLDHKEKYGRQKILELPDSNSMNCNISRRGGTKAFKYLYVVPHVQFYISYKFHMWKQLLSQDEVVWVSDNCEFDAI